MKSERDEVFYTTHHKQCPNENMTFIYVNRIFWLCLALQMRNSCLMGLEEVMLFGKANSAEKSLARAFETFGKKEDQESKK
ncbi:hypothetical protein QF042_002456 [Pedobacter sp. W3I1]|nr:hypothetical protein [Pedobacter sp. W3I1]